MKIIKKNKEFFKSIGVVLISEALIYFLIKNFIHDYNNISTLGIEFPLIKEFIYIYNSWYPFVFITAFIGYRKDKELYKKLIFAMIIGIILSQLTFIIYPTIVIRPEIEVKNLTDYILYLTYYFDTPAVNCLPSVHCLLCFISMYYITINKNLKNKIKIPIIIYFILIVLSTFFTQQHLLIDAILAFIYTIISIIIVHIFYPKLKRALKFLF